MTSKPHLHSNSHALRVETEGRAPETLDWSAVREVFAFKEDVFAYDIICIGFRTDDAGGYLKIDEECHGYKELLEFLPQVFPGIRTDWFSDVAFPAFSPCVTTMWGEAKIETLWKTEQSDAHEPPPRVSVSMLRVLWTLDSLPASAPSGGR